MQSMDKDGATVVDMVADWLEENGYDGMTGRSVRAIQVMRHRLRKTGEARTDE